jgi:hypothetical protein
LPWAWRYAGAIAAFLAHRYHLAVSENDFAVQALGRCRLFGSLGQGSLEAIARNLRTRRFRRGEVLFHQGDPGDALFIMVAGAVKVVVPSEEATRRSWQRFDEATSSASLPSWTGRRDPPARSH